MPNNASVIAELDKIDASRGAIALEWPEAPAPSMLKIQEGSAELRDALPPELGDEIVVGVGETLDLSGLTVAFKKLHVRGGRLITNPGPSGTRLTIKNVPHFGDDNEWPGVVVEGAVLPDGTHVPGYWDAEGGAHVQDFADPARPVVVASEGTTAADVLGSIRVQHHGVARVRGVLFHNVGDTRVGEITTANPPRNYGFHFHHWHAAEESYVEDCFFLCDIPGVKWAGPVAHRSSFLKVRGNVVVGSAGAGVVGEDGAEWQNDFGGNWVKGCVGDGTHPSDGTLSDLAMGGDGAAYWTRGAWNFVGGRPENSPKYSGGVIEDCDKGVMIFLTPSRRIDPSWSTGYARLPKWLGAHTDVAGEYWQEPVNLGTASSLAKCQPIRGLTIRRCRVGVEPWKQDVSWNKNTAGVLWLDGCAFEECQLGVRGVFCHSVLAEGTMFGTPAAPCVEGIRLHSDLGTPLDQTVHYNHYLGLKDCGVHCTSFGASLTLGKGLLCENVQWSGPIGFNLAGHFVSKWSRVMQFLNNTWDCAHWIRTYPMNWQELQGNPETFAYFAPTRLVFNDPNAGGVLRELFLPEQLPDYIPPQTAGGGNLIVPPVLGKTNAELVALGHLPAFGYLAPEGCVADDRFPGFLLSPPGYAVRPVVNPQPTNPTGQQRVRLDADTVEFKVAWDIPCRPKALYCHTTNTWHGVPPTPFGLQPVFQADGVPDYPANFGVIYEDENQNLAWFGHQTGNV